MKRAKHKSISAAVDADSIRRALLHIHKRQLRVVMLVIASYYLFLGTAHYFLLDGFVQNVLMATAALTIVVALWTRSLLPLVRPTSRLGLWMFFPAGLAIYANIYAHVFLTGEQLQLTNSLIGLMVLAFVALSVPLFWCLTSVAVTMHVLALVYVPGPYTAHFAFMLIAGLFLTIAAFIQRYRTLRSEIGLTLLNRRRARHLSELNAAVERASEAKGMFLANTTHELRTPLTGIIGMLKLLSETELNKDQQELVGVANHAADGLLVLINDILDVSRLEEGQMRLEPRAFSVSLLAQNVMQLMGENARAKGLDFRAPELPPEDIRLVGDPIRIGQIIFNLVGNAIKYTKAGFVEVRLRIEGGDEQAKLVFEVEDSGVGMTEEDAARLFKRFERGDPSARVGSGGAGLGLSICRQLAELMGGDILVESEVGKGSCFRFIANLPVADEIDLVDETMSQTELANTVMLGGANFEVGANQRPERSPEGGAEILVAEDNPVNRLLIGKLLAQWPHRFAENGRQAVQLFSDSPERYGLVLMDVRMPEMDGVEATKTIRALGSWGADVPLYALTANDAGEDRALYESVGMNGLIAKPIDQDVLHRLVQKVLMESRRTYGLQSGLPSCTTC